MKLYKVNQYDNPSSKAYKSFVCVANDEEHAKSLDPTHGTMNEWCLSEKNVEAVYLGRTTHYKRGTIIIRSKDD